MARRAKRVVEKKAVDWVRHAMSLASINQTELARRMGVGHSYISVILRLKRDFRVSTLFAIMSACGFEVTELRVRKKPN